MNHSNELPNLISIIIPTLNAQTHLPACLTALVPGVVSGTVREVICADGGSADHTELIAEQAGATFVSGTKGRGTQMAAGAAIAKCDWLLFLHADTVLEAGWELEVGTFMERLEQTPAKDAAAVFRFTLDDAGMKPRLLEKLVAIRSTLLRLPYGDQGLLISRRLYDEIGGFRGLPLMEDIDLVRRLGRGQMTVLRTRAITSAVRFQRDGYLKRSGRNLFCLALYYLKVPSKVIVRFYE